MGYQGTCCSNVLSAPCGGQSAPTSTGHPAKDSQTLTATDKSPDGGVGAACCSCCSLALLPLPLPPPLEPGTCNHFRFHFPGAHPAPTHHTSIWRTHAIHFNSFSCLLLLLANLPRIRTAATTLDSRLSIAFLSLWTQPTPSDFLAIELSALREQDSPPIDQARSRHLHNTTPPPDELGRFDSQLGAGTWTGIAVSSSNKHNHTRGSRLHLLSRNAKRTSVRQHPHHRRLPVPTTVFDIN